LSGRLVLDASAAVRAVLPFQGAEEVLNHLESVALVLAPTLFCSEVANTLFSGASPNLFRRFRRRCGEATPVSPMPSDPGLWILINWGQSRESLRNLSR
jgi:hypothetical protein